MPAQSFAFPKSARLNRAGEFARLRREGRSMRGNFLILSWVKSAAGPEVRLGIITSRRVGDAVQRNRVRRRLREIFRLDRPRLRPERWLVLVARPAAVKAGYDELRNEWRRLAERADMFNTVV
ncbi:MAG: ribonuclease P protein component [Chthoniobacteraceae bacterium]